MQRMAYLMESKARRMHTQWLKTSVNGIPRGGGGRTIGPYADCLPLSSQFQGGGVGGGGGGAGSGGGVWGRLKGRGAPGPQHIWLKMTPSSR